MSNRDRSLLFGQFTNFSYLFRSGLEETLTEMAAFLASSLCDEKIVNPDVCDTIIQGIYVFFIIVISIELAFIKRPCFGFHWFLEFAQKLLFLIINNFYSPLSHKIVFFFLYFRR